MKYLSTICFGALVALVTFALGWCGRGRLALAPAPVSVVHDTIKGDSVPYVVTLPTPYPRYVTLPPDTVIRSAYIDTAAILADYLAMYRYVDTLLNDTSAFIALDELVTQNRISERVITFQNRRPTYITTTMVQPEPALQLSAGALLGRNLAAPMLQAQWRRWQLSAGYNLQGGGVVVGLGYKFLIPNS